ncbi:MAG: hypothetical protein JW839_14325, partial [Candidatus Lokiarchaeota archaeon]|nr:hypothetical protein [Candidatus Lokiarchaeota archaeon]
HLVQADGLESLSEMVEYSTLAPAFSTMLMNYYPSLKNLNLSVVHGFNEEDPDEKGRLSSEI